MLSSVSVPGIQLHDMVMRLRKLRGSSRQSLLQGRRLHALDRVLLREGEYLPFDLLHLLPGKVTKRLYYLGNAFMKNLYGRGVIHTSVCGGYLNP